MDADLVIVRYAPCAGRKNHASPGNGQVLAGCCRVLCWNSQFVQGSYSKRTSGLCIGQGHLREPWCDDFCGIDSALVIGSCSHQRTCLGLAWNTMQFVDHHVPGCVREMWIKQLAWEWQAICRGGQHFGRFDRPHLFLGLLDELHSRLGAVRFLSYGQIPLFERSFGVHHGHPGGDVPCLLWGKVWKKVATLEQFIYGWRSCPIKARHGRVCCGTGDQVRRWEIHGHQRQFESQWELHTFVWRIHHRGMDAQVSAVI